jgi:DNA-binding transcriptional ArsR family regulator
VQIVFTERDLTRVRLADTPHALSEITFSDLAGLLGATRARVIRAVAAGCTTTELARALGIAPATASEHATVLRNQASSAPSATATPCCTR